MATSVIKVAIDVAPYSSINSKYIDKALSKFGLLLMWCTSVDKVDIPRRSKPITSCFELCF